MTIPTPTRIMYFILQAGMKNGPFTKEELYDMRLKQDCMVWREGMTDWAPVMELPELEHLVVKSPPPTPGERKASEATAGIGGYLKKNYLAMIIIGGLFAALMFLTSGVLKSDSEILDYLRNQPAPLYYTNPASARASLFFISLFWGAIVGVAGGIPVWFVVQKIYEVVFRSPALDIEALTKNQTNDSHKQQ